mmetsp:Transcript_31862/g.98587  ORF Transcript_31862/g.98587 Transcript_31862/m.98587 type:complete len:205 (-) Transcript_31862:939-1553(-)
MPAAIRSVASSGVSSSGSGLSGSSWVGSGMLAVRSFTKAISRRTSIGPSAFDLNAAARDKGTVATAGLGNTVASMVATRHTLWKLSCGPICDAANVRTSGPSARCTTGSTSTLTCRDAIERAVRSRSACSSALRSFEGSVVDSAPSSFLASPSTAASTFPCSSLSAAIFFSKASLRGVALMKSAANPLTMSSKAATCPPARPPP